jgi:hypothetical protein
MGTLSTLTKILVVLLSLFAVFLCGMVVSYVGSANHFKSQYESEKLAREAIQAENLSLAGQFNEQVAKTKELEHNKATELLSLQEHNNQLLIKLQNAERIGQEYQVRAESWKGVLTGFEQSVASMLESLKLTRDQLEIARSQNITNQKDLSQITASLYEKIVELERLQADRRRILEQKTELENQVSQPGGSAGAATPGPVTQIPGRARPAAIMTASEIQGLIMEVDQSLVTLSVGTADGVSKGMVFHVTRGDQFLCDILITDVDVNKCAGVLEMVQQRPKVGDTVATKL